jgi:hypothetical protein
MADVIKKSQVKTPALPKETVTVAGLGGDVIVTGLTLTARLALFSAGKSGYTVSKLLSETVVDADGSQLFTEQEWDNFGAKHFKDCLDLFKVVKRLSGLDAEVEAKNS